MKVWANEPLRFPEAQYIYPTSSTCIQLHIYSTYLSILIHSLNLACPSVHPCSQLASQSRQQLAAVAWVTQSNSSVPKLTASIGDFRGPWYPGWLYCKWALVFVTLLPSRVGTSAFIRGNHSSCLSIVVQEKLELPPGSKRRLGEISFSLNGRGIRASPTQPVYDVWKQLVGHIRSMFTQ